jgi:hypothetical protein
VGCDADKKVKGRKIHALVDAEELPMRVVVDSAATARLGSTRYVALPMARTDLG